MSQPWMPFYVGDYLADTGHLGAVEHASYLLLIFHYWRTGGIPNDDLQLARISKLTAAQWERVKPTVLAFFDEDLRHKRIDEELGRAQKISNARRESGAKGGAAKSLKRHKPTLANATDLPEQNATQSQPHTHKSLSNDKLTAREQLALAERFYRAYPKHVDPRDAEKKFCALVAKGENPERIIAAAERYAEAQHRAGTEKRFIPAPAVWLNKGGYLSEDLPQPDARAGPPPSNRNGLAAFAREIYGNVDGTTLETNRSSPALRLLPGCDDGGSGPNCPDDGGLFGKVIDGFG